MRLSILIIGLVASFPTFADDQQYLCIADNATGFYWDENTKKWQSTNFNVEGRKHLVERYSATGEYAVFPFGSNSPNSVCGDGFNEDGAIFCSGVEQFSMNNKTLRYRLIYLLGGYVIGDDSGNNDEYMEIGKCSPL